MPVGRSRASTSYSRPYWLSRLAVLMIRCAQLAEEVLVGSGLDAGEARGHGVPVGLVEEDDVQVAVVVHLLAAELAQRQDHHLAGLARAGAFADRRLAELAGQSLSYSLAAICSRQTSAMSRQGRGRGLHVLLAQEVAHAHAELLVVLEAVQDRVEVLGRRGRARASVAWSDSRVGSLSSTRLSIRPSIMPGLLVRMPREVGAVGAELDVQPQRRRVEAEQLPEHALAAQRIAHLVEVHQRRIGIGRGGDGLQQLRGDRRPGSAGSGASKGSGSSPRPAPSGCDRPASRRGRDTCPAPRRSAPRAGRDRAPGRPRPRCRRRRRRRRAAGGRGSGGSGRSCSR